MELLMRGTDLLALHYRKYIQVHIYYRWSKRILGNKFRIEMFLVLDKDLLLLHYRKNSNHNILEYLWLNHNAIHNQDHNFRNLLLHELDKGQLRFR